MGEFEKRLKEITVDWNWRAECNAKSVLEIVEEAKKEFPLLPQGEPIDYDVCLRIQAQRRDWFVRWFAE